MGPRSPCDSNASGPAMAAVKYRIFDSPPAGASAGVGRLPLPNVRPQRPEMEIGTPEPSCNAPRNRPLRGSNALIVPSPKLPTSRDPAKSPKVAGATVIPQGEFRGPP